MKRTPVLMTVTIGIVLPGCMETQRPILVDSPRPLRAEFAAGSATVVAERWLLLPIHLDASKKNAWGSFGSGGYVISGSAWSGLAFSKGGYGTQRLNLDVVDLTANRHDLVFERQVALGDWDLSYRENARGQLHFENTLILSARTADTNGDKQIDAQDAVYLYTYDLAKRDLKRISPEGHSVASVDIVGERIVVTLWDMGHAGQVGVFGYEPRSGEGRFIVEHAQP